MNIHRIKWCYLVVLGGLICLSTVCCSSREKDDSLSLDTLGKFVEQHGRLKVEGSKLLDQQDQPIVLQGVSLGWHNWWPRFYEAQTINWLNSDWNCHLVRAAIGVGPENSYLDNPTFALDRLYTVVDAAIDLGMYVIVDWHSHELHPREAKEFFQKVARKYKDQPNILYEIYNEPIEDSWPEVKTYAEEIIHAIRQIDPEGIILIGCPHWDQDIHLVADDPIVGYDNIMYTVHFYAGTHKQSLRDRAEYALERNIPVFISECASMEASGDGPIDHKEWETWRTWMAKHDLSWVAWSLADKDETCSMIRDTHAPIASWRDEHLKEWGKIIRNTLRENK